MADWTKAQLLADLATTYIAMDEPKLEDTSYGVNWYRVNVFETGILTTDGTPTGYRKNVHFYVLNEGTPEEKAFMDKNELASINNDVQVDENMGDAAFKIFTNARFRQRVVGYIIIQAKVVIDEPVDTPYHEQRLVMAKKAFENPESLLNPVMVVVANGIREMDLTDPNSLADLEPLIGLTFQYLLKVL
jgi:hypothetical protein